ncbi:MAG: hypothetical protein K8R60_07410 [Burkholderiales bacterium]|nr:hypothetical protein [Burkholderiales bacterium]
MTPRLGMLQLPTPSAGNRALGFVKVAHTVIWAFFAACIVAIPIASLLGEHSVAAWLAAVVLVEVLVLALNSMRCPLTAVAARYTVDRRPNFDIFLPEWLAKYNKFLFGTLYVAGVAFALSRWLRVPG